MPCCYDARLAVCSLRTGIGQFFIAGLGGIRREEGTAGFQTFELRPAFSPAATQVTAQYLSPYGLVNSSYVVRNSSAGVGGGGGLDAVVIEYSVTVPPNTMATVYIPATSPTAVTEGPQGRPVKMHTGPPSR